MDFASDYSDPTLGGNAAAIPSTPAFVPPGASALALNLAEENHKLKCPKCDLVQAASHKICSNCGHDLAEARKAKFAKLGQEDAPAELLLSDFAIPDERKYPIPDLAQAKLALSRSAGKPEEAKVKAAVLQRYPELKGQDLSQEGHAVTFYSTMQLGGVKPDAEGLIWKALCKTGELALSPGPGQVDVEKPLQLTPDLFKELDLSVKEQAFPYVTVPTTHANGLLENSGYVKKTKIVPSTDPKDPPGTELLMGGIHFTDKDVKGKVEDGSIPDTSIGVKFNYRNKRTGKLYAAALEHVALTHQPWVDGLPAFGMLSQDEVPGKDAYEGVYMSADQAEAEETPAEDILPGDAGIDGIPAQFFSIETKPMPPTKKAHTRTRRAPARQPQAETVEQLLAQQQVRIETAEQRAEEAEERAARAEGRGDSQAQAIHMSNVTAKVNQWQKDNLPPAVIAKAKDILLAAGPQPHEVTEDNAVLTLSITEAPGTEGGDPTVKEQHMSVEDIVDVILSQVPKFGPGTSVHELVQEHGELMASQRPDSEKTSKEKADKLYDEAKERTTGAGQVA
jgi:hypothetical protein